MPKTPKQHTPFKISSVSLSEEKTDDLPDAAKESLVNTLDNSWFNDRGDAIYFRNDDFEADEPELIKSFTNSIDVKDRFPEFNENYHFFPISTNETQDAAVTDVSEIIETTKLSTPNNYSENSSEKNSSHDDVFADTNPTVASPEESNDCQLPNNSEEIAIDYKKTEKKKNLRKGQEVFQAFEEN
ncbi:hypothetical protein TNIN_193451 [Trichonephila inaurata madagascariensis]|uniref:Uncharacterized protein n=1 Tax=Trichonephila inaurata madagascariensis TaxID=2747483 RepID=A0A8X7CHG5_9ARAC|nr:hypothetical protein TNIN_193451 [Trichonephila inaurata madagascariensis]